jgi:arginyl-tRNA synthetase
LFEFGGGVVHRLNYPSDIGLTVAKAVWGLSETEGDPSDIKQIGEAYKKGNEAYENDTSAKEEIETVNRSLYAGDDPKLQELRREGIKTSRTHLAKLCAKLGTVFDAEVTESEAGPVGAEIVKKHTGTVFEESEGAVVYKGEKRGLHTRVFLNSQGLPTYEAKDLGNFTLKQEKYPNWTHSYVVTGNEQREYFKVLTEALKEVFPEAKDKHIEHISTGFLTLNTGKMSSRKGNVLTGEDILDGVAEVAHKRAKESRAADIDELANTLAVSAIKYQILRQALGTDIVFDKERALSLDGDSGPYLEYTHARIYSILNKAKAAELEPNTDNKPEKIYETERLLYQFPEIVSKAQEEHAPHHLVTYLTELAGSFNSFYSQEKIVDTEDEFAPYKLALTEAVGVTLKNGLNLLGIEAVDRM